MSWKNTSWQQTIVDFLDVERRKTDRNKQDFVKYEAMTNDDLKILIGRQHIKIETIKRVNTVITRLAGCVLALYVSFLMLFSAEIINITLLEVGTASLTLMIAVVSLYSRKIIAAKNLLVIMTIALHSKSLVTNESDNFSSQ